MKRRTKNGNSRRGDSNSDDRCSIKLLVRLTSFVALTFILFREVSGAISHVLTKFSSSSQMSASQLRSESDNAEVESSSSSTHHENDDDKNNNKKQMMIPFQGFDDSLIPANSVLDVNIGTNKSPIGSQEGRHRILVDPLFGWCEKNAGIAKNGDVTAFCFAVSNYTGFATFFEYNQHGGLSSSLSQVSSGTSHERLQVLSRRTVLVLEAKLLFEAIKDRGSRIHRLKLDMQGHELTTILNIQNLLLSDNNSTTTTSTTTSSSSGSSSSSSSLATHIMAECFCDNPQSGKQIYQIDNSCHKIAQVLQQAGYETKWNCPLEYGDVFAYKKGMATDFLTDNDFANVANQ